jgi:hypothetical protein
MLRGQGVHVSARVGYILLILLTISGCGAGAPDEPRLPADLTPSERTSLDRIFTDLKRATRDSFEKNDWSIMAKLFPATMLACWDASGEDHRFGFLSMKPIPDSAEYTVGSLEKYYFGGWETSGMGGTHYMSVRYEETFLEGCNVPVTKRWPEKHFYLRREGGQFQLVHPCPNAELIEKKMIVRTSPVTGVGRAAEVVAGMSAAEKEGLRKLIEQDAFPLNAMNSLQGRYRLTEDESSMALELICSTSHEASE